MLFVVHLIEKQRMQRFIQKRIFAIEIHFLSVIVLGKNWGNMAKEKNQ